MEVRVQEDSFDPGLERNAFTKAQGNVGAGVSFSGIVRDTEEGLSEMLIEHYPGMTERALSEITQQAITRWNLSGALVIHRHGQLVAGEVIMMVATASKHRADAFQSADFLMDYLKSRAPFWKKERTGAGEAWVAAKDDDEAALDRW